MSQIFNKRLRNLSIDSTEEVIEPATVFLTDAEALRDAQQHAFVGYRKHPDIFLIEEHPHKGTTEFEYFALSVLNTILFSAFWLLS